MSFDLFSELRRCRRPCSNCEWDLAVLQQPELGDCIGCRSQEHEIGPRFAEGLAETELPRANATHCLRVIAHR
jgi:hypothetical protein